MDEISPLRSRGREWFSSKIPLKWHYTICLLNYIEFTFTKENNHEKENSIRSKPAFWIDIH